MSASKILPSTGVLHRRRIRVHYPAGRGRMVLRTELDWERDLEPADVSRDGNTSTFGLEARRPFLYFKPCSRSADGILTWSVGPNMLALMTTDGAGDVHPDFDGAERGSFSGLALRPGSALASEADLMIPRCVPGAPEALAIAREHHVAWTRCARG